MSRTITARQLEAAGACPGQVAKFRELFPSGTVRATQKLAREYAGTFDWEWAASNLLTPAALAEYEKVAAAAWAEYEKVADPAWAEYLKVDAATLAEYLKVDAAARAEYEKVAGPALAEYEKVAGPAFVKAYNQKEQG